MTKLIEGPEGQPAEPQGSRPAGHSDRGGDPSTPGGCPNPTTLEVGLGTEISNGKADALAPPGPGGPKDGDASGGPASAVAVLEGPNSSHRARLPRDGPKREETQTGRQAAAQEAVVPTIAFAAATLRRAIEEQERLIAAFLAPTSDGRESAASLCQAFANLIHHLATQREVPPQRRIELAEAIVEEAVLQRANCPGPERFRDWFREIVERAVDATLVPACEFAAWVEEWDATARVTLAGVQRPRGLELDELIQMVVARALGSRRTFRPDCAFGPWMHRIAVNAARDALRSKARRREVPLSGAPDAKLLAPRSPEEAWAAEFEEYLRHLDEADRALLRRRFLDDAPLKELARELRRSIPTALRRVRRALERLRRLLEQVEQDAT